MERNTCQIVQKTENLLFCEKISFSCLNPNNCRFVQEFYEKIIYEVAQLCYEYNDRALKFYLDIASVTSRPCYFLPPYLIHLFWDVWSFTKEGGILSSAVVVIMWLNQSTVG